MKRLKSRSRLSVQSGFNSSVFINCPFDDDYLVLLRPLLFSVITIGFTPRISSERSDSVESRIDKISGLIRESRFSIHDLTRLKPGKNNFARMNMPFELGIDYGARAFGGDGLSTKRCLILGGRPYEYQKALSDLSGVDIKIHGEDPETLVRNVRDWFFETCGIRPAPSWKAVWFSYTDFMSALHDAGAEHGLSEQDLDRMPIAEFIHHAQQWPPVKSRMSTSRRKGVRSARAPRREARR